MAAKRPPQAFHLDTVDVKLATDGENMRIRLIGIDAPESVNPDES